MPQILFDCKTSTIIARKSTLTVIMDSLQSSLIINFCNDLTYGFGIISIPKDVEDCITKLNRERVVNNTISNESFTIYFPPRGKPLQIDVPRFSSRCVKNASWISIELWAAWWWWRRLEEWNFTPKKWRLWIWKWRHLGWAYKGLQSPSRVELVLPFKNKRKWWKRCKNLV